MNRHTNAEASDTDKAVLRRAPAPLSNNTIARMALGQILADGVIRPGAGSLKVRKRATSGSPVVEYFFAYHHGGKLQRMALGRYTPTEAPGALTLTQARDEARRLQEIVRAGGSPLAQREIEREATRVHQAALLAQTRVAAEKTFGALLTAYVDSLRERGKKDSAYDVANIFSNHVERPFADLWTLPATAIEPAHIARILARLVGPDVSDKKGRTAVKLRASMAAAFKVAAGASLDPMAVSGAAGFGITSNPAAAVPVTSMSAKFNVAGERVLSREELAHYIAHLYALPHSLPALVLQLQLVTAGQRLAQLLRLRREDVSNLTITMTDPKGRRTKARAHVLPMVAEAREVIDATLSIIDKYEKPQEQLFANARGAVVVPESLSEVARNISTLMLELSQSEKPFRLGDVRRTVETMLSGDLGISKDVRAQLLSHGLSGVQDRHYDKHLHLEPKRNALRRWNDFVADLCIGAQGAGNVVSLRGSA